MAPARFVSLFLFCAAAALGSVPANLVGSVYSEVTEITATGLRGTNQMVLLLQPNGRYTGLFFEHRSSRYGYVRQTSIPPDGTWSYRPLTDHTAELNLDGRVRVLSGSSSGTIASPDNLLVRISFALSVLDPAAQLSNCSSRSYVRAGSSAFAGFVISHGTRRVLIRAIGPTLQAFGISDALRTPLLKVVRVGESGALATNPSGPSQNLAAVHARAGAFPLPANSGDCALFLSLEPGAYIAEARSSNPNEAGEVLIEIYALP